MMSTHKEEKTYQPQGGRIPQGSALDLNIVPVEPTSSSCNGQSSLLPASDEPRDAIVEVKQVKVAAGAPDIPIVSTQDLLEQGNDSLGANVEEKNIGSLNEKEEIGERDFSCNNNKRPDVEDIDSVSTVSCGCVMDCEDVRASKRRCSSEEREDEVLRRVKVRRRQRIFTEDTASKLSKEQSKSNPDLTRSSGEDPKIMKMKKGYTSKLKRLEIEEAKEEIETAKREEIRRKREEAVKAAEEKRKREDKIKAENSILSKISGKVIPERDYIDNMTASDLTSLAFEYFDHVELIRTKRGTMQGALSGELKRKKICLDNMVRALRAKAKDKDDPSFLRAKIEELLKKNREEEQKRKREISEMRELISNLNKENKEMRKELAAIKDNIACKRETRGIEKGKKVYSHREEAWPALVCDNSGPPLLREDSRPSLSREVPRILSPHDKQRPTSSRDDPRVSNDGLVMRPPLKDKTAPIPNSLHKQKGEARMAKEISEEMEIPKEKRKRPVIKVKENIQIKPPRNIEVRRKEEYERIEEEVEPAEDREMDWENGECGEGWTQEPVKRKSSKKMRKESQVQGEAWTEVVKKGKSKKTEGKAPERKAVTEKKLKAPATKRKPPRTAAVSIKGDVCQGFSYEEALKKARTQIQIEDLEISSARIRKRLNGATIIEVSGPGCHEKAQTLADKLQQVLQEDKATITVPTVKGEVRLTGLDESIGKDEVMWAIEEEGNCGREETRIGEIRRNRRGMGTVLIQCPLKAAIQVAKKQKIRIGWTVVGVTLLETRALQCYRCWHHGHVKETCRSVTDRSRCCFRCGSEGHRSVNCNSDLIPKA